MDSNKLVNLEQFPSYSVKNRYEFINEIKNIKLTEDEYLVSFDVEALYPNVPMDKTLNLVNDWLLSLNLSPQEIKEYMILINLCMKQNTFQFNNKYYTQLDGTAMGNPLSCLLANIFMGHFEILAIETINYFPRIWKRYVDDVFAVFNKNQDIQEFVQKLNSIYPTIKFTFEVEKD